MSVASWEAAVSTITGRYKTQVEDTESLATQYDNFPPINIAADAHWSRWTVIPGDSSQVQLGAAKTFRHFGVAVAQIFGPAVLGTEEAWRLADVIKTAFRAVTDTGVRFRTPFSTRVGVTGDHWQLNVTCPFYFDEVV